MDLQGMRNRVFSYINYVDGSADPITNSDITTTEVDRWINDRYLEDLFPEYASLHPEYYSAEAVIDNYAATGTVAAGSTSSTLVASTAIFTSNMVDGIAYNSTDDETRKITAYTNTTTVTVDSAIDDDWDGDTIYIFTGLFTYADTYLVHKPIWVGVKWTSSDLDFTRCDPLKDEDLYNSSRGRTADTLFSQAYPVYTFQTESVSSVPTSTIKIRPFDWTANIEDSVYLKYVKKPAELTNTTDVPRIPLGGHKGIVFGATADALMKLEKFDQANQYEAKFIEAKQRLMKIRPSERPVRTIDFMKNTLPFTRRSV